MTQDGECPHSKITYIGEGWGCCEQCGDSSFPMNVPIADREDIEAILRHHGLTDDGWNAEVAEHILTSLSNAWGSKERALEAQIQKLAEERDRLLDLKCSDCDEEATFHYCGDHVPGGKR